MEIIVTTRINIDDDAVAEYYDVARRQDATLDIEAAIAREAEHALSSRPFIAYHLEGIVAHCAAEVIA